MAHMTTVRLIVIVREFVVLALTLQCNCYTLVFLNFMILPLSFTISNSMIKTQSQWPKTPKGRPDYHSPLVPHFLLTTDLG